MYETYYKLDRKPFALSPDPGFFFASSGHRRVLSYLKYGIHQGEGFIVVTGEVGAGKTTLIRTLLGELSQSESFVVAQLVTSQMDPTDLVSLVAAEFGVGVEGLTKSQLLKRLQAFLVQRAVEGKRALLIVDEAQNIPFATLEELRMLSNYHVGSRPLLQTCLLGQSELRDALRNKGLEQLRQRVVATCHLGPMKPEETRGYIEHRLKQAGWHRDPDLTASALDAIHAQSSGIPRRINTLCDRILLFGYLEEKHVIDASVVDEVAEELAREYGPVQAGAESASPPPEQPGVDDARLKALESRVAMLEKLVDCRAMAKALAVKLTDTRQTTER